MTTFTGIDYNSYFLSQIDDDFIDWMEENGYNEHDWNEFGDAVREYKKSDRFRSHFFEGFKVQDCVAYWSHYSPYLSFKMREFIESM